MHDLTQKYVQGLFYAATRSKPLACKSLSSRQIVALSHTSKQNEVDKAWLAHKRLAE